MGNNIAIISWPKNSRDADIIRVFSDFRQELGIGVDQYGKKPLDLKLCYVSGETSGGLSTLYTNNRALAEKWLTKCRMFVRDNYSAYGGIAPDSVKMNIVHLPM